MRRAPLSLALPAVLGVWACAPTPPPRQAEFPAPAVVSSSDVLTVEPWTYAGRPGRIVRTRHYRVYSTDTDPVLDDAVPGFLEAALTQYRTMITPLPAPSTKLDTYLMQDRSQWASVTRQLMGEAASTLLRIGRGGYAFNSTAVMYNIGRHDTLSILAHEGWHQYTQRVFRHPLPAWLEEGLATHMEGFVWQPGREAVFSPWRNAERFDQLRRARAQGDLLSLAELLDASPQRLISTSDEGTLTYYAQVWALAHFLVEGQRGRYRPGLERLLADAAAGRVTIALGASMPGPEARDVLRSRVGPAVFKAYFTHNLDEAGAQYDAFIAHVVEPGSRDAVVAGHSPISD